MNRKKFIEELAFLLQDIEDAEREEAMQYYEDYFDEAGPENEQQVINDLGSPERVAAIIKAGLDNQFDQDIEYSEKGWIIQIINNLVKLLMLKLLVKRRQLLMIIMIIKIINVTRIILEEIPTEIESY